MANSYLTHSGSTPTLNTKCTLSAWVKRSAIDSDQTFCSIDTDGSNEIYYRFRSDNQLQVYSQITGGQVFNYRTNRLFRDTSAWYNIVVAIDTTQAGGNRMKIYVNGTQETSFQSSTEMNQNSALGFLSGTYAIGRKNNITGNYFDGYLSHVAFVDGQQLAPTVFGETDSTSGIWKFKSPSGVTWGTNGFHLKFENSGALGTDSSGQSNTFTVNGDLKQALDTPSNIYCTMNPIDANAGAATIKLANGNNTIMSNSGSSDYGLRSTLAASKGKFYFECKMNVSGNTIGVADMAMRIIQNKNAGGSLQGGDTWAIQRYDGSQTNTYNNGTFLRTANLWGGMVDGDIVGIAMDLDNGKFYFSKNGAFKDTSGNTGDPANGTYPTFTIGSYTAGENFYGPWAENRANTDNASQFNFGNGFFGTTAITSAGSNGNGSLFEFDVPSGFYALNTKNLNTYG